MADCEAVSVPMSHMMAHLKPSEKECEKLRPRDIIK